MLLSIEETKFNNPQLSSDLIYFVAIDCNFHLRHLFLLKIVFAEML